MTEFLHFWQMGGYGAYIWSAMGIAFLLMVLEPILLVMQRKSIIKDIKRIKRMEQRTQAHK